MSDIANRVASRILNSSYIDIGDKVRYGKYKSSFAIVTGFGKDKHGNPTIQFQPIDKDGKKKGGAKEQGLFKVWKFDVNAG